MKACKHCGEVNHYSFQCFRRPQKPIEVRTRIKPFGKRQQQYKVWRDTVAIPYLDKTFGRKCADCGGSRCGNNQLDVDHIKNRGSHPELKMSLSNVQYLGRFPCHVEKTTREGEDYKYDADEWIEALNA